VIKITGSFRIKCKSEEEAKKQLDKWKLKGFKGYIGFSKIEGNYIIIETTKN